MKNIRLSGKLATDFGNEIHYFEVEYPQMLLRALIHRMGSKFQRLMVNGKYALGYDKANPNNYYLIPNVKGAGGGIGKIIIGVVIVVVAVVFQQYWAIGLGLSLALAGVTEMMAGSPSTGDYLDAETPENKPSFVFNGPVNVQEQGGPVPLVYGRIRTGSTVISAGSESVRI